MTPRHMLSSLEITSSPSSLSEPSKKEMSERISLYRVLKSVVRTILEFKGSEVSRKDPGPGSS